MWLIWAVVNNRWLFWCWPWNILVNIRTADNLAPCVAGWSATIKLIMQNIQYIPRNMHTVFALLCFVVVIHWLIFPYPSSLLHWHCGNLTIAPVPAKQPWWIWINTSCEFIINDDITTTKQSTTKPCAYFLGYTVWVLVFHNKGFQISEPSLCCVIVENTNIFVCFPNKSQVD